MLLQGNVFTFLQQNGGRLPESVVVPMILEPTMSALNYIHELVGGKADQYEPPYNVHSTAFREQPPPPQHLDPVVDDNISALCH